MQTNHQQQATKPQVSKDANTNQVSASPASPPYNPYVRNNQIFAILYVVFQIIIIFFYGIFIRPQAHFGIIDSGLFSAVGAGFLVLIGFGLYFSYLNKMRWSGLGFTFLITALVFQYYFLINGFWSKANVQMSNTNFSSTEMPAYLSDQNADTANGGIDTLGNTAVGAFKCALSLSIAFAAIGGRGGPLEALIIVVFGTVTYELNRQILSLFSVNQGGSATIFEFGGFLGATISVILYFCRHKQYMQNHRNYTSSEFNVTMALVGSAFIWVFFPVINMDIPSTLFIFSNAGISTILCISGCVVATIAFTLIINGKIEYRDLITAPIVGGVVIGSSSTYVYNPTEAILIGIVAGLLQVFFNKAQIKFGKTPYWSNGVFFLFGIQGFLASLFSSVVRAINKSSSTFEVPYNTLIAKYSYNQSGQISATFITLGISIVTGLVISLLLLVITKEREGSLYDDNTYWDVHEDGLSNRVKDAAAPSSSQSAESATEFAYSMGKSQGDHQYL